MLHVVLTPRYSGAEILVRDLSLVHAGGGHQVGVCALAPAEPSFEVEVARLRAAGVSWYLPAEPLRRFGRVAALRRWIREFCPDVVIAHASIPSFYTRLAAWFRGGPPVISVLHNASEDDYAEPAFRFAERLVKRRTAAVVAVSQPAMDNYVRRLGAPRRIGVIRNGIHLSRFVRASDNRAACRASLGLGPETLLALQVGRLNEVKAQRTTFQAVRPLLAPFPTLVLWFAGLIEDQSELERLRADCQAAGAGDRVKVLGPRADVAELMAAADVHVMPSLAEAHSVAMLESLASGAAIVASDIPAFRAAGEQPGVRLVRSGDVVSLTEAVADALGSGKRYARDMSAYSIESTAAAYVRLAEEVVS
jgi:glycosyltransferase involved in cell wall biosynthesis